MKFPNLYIVGQPKSWTTSLYNILKNHPDIYMSPNKEPNFFCKDLYQESIQFHWKNNYFDYETYEQYQDLFKKSSTEKYIWEASTSYLYSQNAASLIKKYSPDAHIVIMLREPSSFLHSLHRQFIIQWFEDQQDFGEALKLEQKRKEWNCIPSNVRAPSVLYYLERAKNYKQIKRYYDQFNSDRIHVILFEDFIKDSLTHTNKILEKFWIEKFEDLSFMNDYQKNQRKKVRSFAMLSVFRNPKITKTVRSLMSESWYFTLKKLIDTLLYTPEKNKRTSLSIDLASMIQSSVYDDVSITSDLIGIDLHKKWWF